MKRVGIGILLFALCSYGQGTTSRALGTVTDTTGAAVANAEVTLTNESTQATFHTTTSSTGTYAFDALQVGKYTIEVTAQGFKKYTSRENAVTIGQPSTINVTLDIGAVTETV